MLRQYLSFILVTAITAATVNAGCCIVSPPPNTECADTSELTSFKQAERVNLKLVDNIAVECSSLNRGSAIKSFMVWNLGVLSTEHTGTSAPHIFKYLILQDPYSIYINLNFDVR
ncbi:hypothetical protein PTNB73_10128 [Pyrenophora teres f. teres]|nr:hypothetical protein PTNB85_09879 [Pyrenophora teres f. teres]KAE8855471.1 hypothetical protein PTNB73_10128 [Pyrenophora teres f. teres]